MPPSENPLPDQPGRVIDFERADVVSLMIYPPPPPNLVVAGEKPFANMRVSLNPLCYVQKPEYWGIQVVGSTPSIGQPAIVPYVVELDLTGYIGTRGIEVIGASHTERIELAAAPPETAPDGTPA